jgi:hypothetical protein
VAGVTEELVFSLAATLVMERPEMDPFRRECGSTCIDHRNDNLFGY